MILVVHLLTPFGCDMLASGIHRAIALAVAALMRFCFLGMGRLIPLVVVLVPGGPGPGQRPFAAGYGVLDYGFQLFVAELAAPGVESGAGGHLGNEAAVHGLVPDGLFPFREGWYGGGLAELSIESGGALAFLSGEYIS